MSEYGLQRPPLTWTERERTSLVSMCSFSVDARYLDPNDAARVGRGCRPTSPPIHTTSPHSTTCYTRSCLLRRPRMPPLPHPRNLPKKRARTLGATRCTENTLLGKPNQLPMYIVAPGYRAAAHTARVPDPLPAQKRPIIQRACYRATNEAAGHPSRGEDTSASGDAPRATCHPPHAARRPPRGSRRPALRRPHDRPAPMWELGGMRGQRAKLGRPRSETRAPPAARIPPSHPPALRRLHDRPALMWELTQPSRPS
ncbi:hypothetical protein B0H14DRAFT_3421920 [Mycena olivaceomarginata]|nr:hypothetical protein B0H14DRAFT_3421920 [Mycena olivaceomarginata]